MRGKELGCNVGEVHTSGSCIRNATREGAAASRRVNPDDQISKQGHQEYQVIQKSGFQCSSLAQKIGSSGIFCLRCSEARRQHSPRRSTTSNVIRCVQMAVVLVGQSEALRGR